MNMRRAMSDKLQFVAGVALVETHDKLKLVGHLVMCFLHATKDENESQAGRLCHYF
jgi:hypothetical protein